MHFKLHYTEPKSYCVIFDIQTISILNIELNIQCKERNSIMGNDVNLNFSLWQELLLCKLYRYIKAHIRSKIRVFEMTNIILSACIA